MNEEEIFSQQSPSYAVIGLLHLVTYIINIYEYNRDIVKNYFN